MRARSAFVRVLRRWRWRIALAVCVLPAISILAASELGHRELARGYERSSQAIWLGARLNELSARLAEAETGQRSYLLTWNAEYLEPYRRAVPLIRSLLDQLRPYYANRPDPEADQVFGALVAAIGAKLGEIELTLQLTERARADRALEVIESGMGRRTMDEIRFLLEDLAAREEALVNDAYGDWAHSLAVSRASIASAIGLSIFLVTVLMCAVRRDWRRSAERESLLDRLVHERTRQLDTLARRLQEASEAEKAALARELHDEFGAILTVSKMDLAWVSRQLNADQASLAARLAEITDLLDQGLLAKRRIVEGLRPSALSHFGLGVAARELAERYASRAGWSLRVRVPEVVPTLSDDVEIMLYRVLQESLTNAVKYAAARNVEVELVVDPGRYVLRVCDDGIGFDVAAVRSEAQGIFGMRHRVEARCGHFTIDSRPGCGTRVTAVIPAARRPAPGVVSRTEPGLNDLGVVTATV
jgi:signal transduction histidine kinase